MGNIKSVKEIGEFQTYDLEIDHSDHQFYLSNGMLTSNSHATTYSMISFHTAYLKAHYPIEFLMANLMAEVKSSTPDARANIDKLKKELRQHKVKIEKPDINRSQLTYTIENGNLLITGLDAIKYVGDDAIKDIISKRPFKDFFDFMVRVSSKTVRANSIQALAACGALDSFGIKRKDIFLYCSDYRKKLQIWLKKHDPNIDIFIYPFPSQEEWSKPELYALEQFYLGESFVCKPPVAYVDFFKDQNTDIKEIRHSKDRTKFASIKGIVKDYFEFRVKKEGSKYYGMSMVKAVLEDRNGEQCALTIFPDRWEQMKSRMQEITKKAEFGPGLALHFSGSTNNYEDSMGIIFDRLFNLALPPAKPAELKAQKINLKQAKKKDEPKTPQQILDDLEDDLYEEGLIDANDDPENE